MIATLKKFFAKLISLPVSLLDEKPKWDAPPPKNPEQLDWASAIPFAFLNFSVLFVFLVGFSPIALILAIVFYFLRMFAITGFYHRYFSHKTFKMNRFWQAFFAILGVTAVQKGPIWWAAHHREHHLYSDKEGDMHSPVQGGFWDAHILWILRQKSFSFNKDRVKDLMKFPELVFISRFHRVIVILFFVLLYFLGVGLNFFFPSLNTSGAQILVWVGLVSTVFNYHCTYAINSLTHMMGRRRYKTTDNSRNSFLISLFTMGEGWHNNHHYCPTTVRQGFHWWQIDFSYYGLKLLEKMHIVKDLRMPPAHVYSEKNPDLIKSAVQKPEPESTTIKKPVTDSASN
ncbi:MAG: acyl-CoA desaturase [Pseudomonadota bacterium]